MRKSRWGIAGLGRAKLNEGHCQLRAPRKTVIATKNPQWAETPEEPCLEVAEHESRELEDRAMDAVDNSGTPPAALTKLTPCGVYTDSVENFRRPTHPHFWILWRAFQNPIFSTSSVIQ